MVHRVPQTTKEEPIELLDCLLTVSRVSSLAELPDLLFQV